MKAPPAEGRGAAFVTRHNAKTLAAHGQKKPDSKREARVAETKEKLSESIQKLFLLYYISFTLFPLFLSFFFIFPLLLFSYFFFTRTCLLLVFGFFWPAGAQSPRCFPQLQTHPT